MVSALVLFVFCLFVCLFVFRSSPLRSDELDFLGFVLMLEALRGWPEEKITWEAT